MSHQRYLGLAAAVATAIDRRWLIVASAGFVALIAFNMLSRPNERATRERVAPEPEGEGT